MPYPNDTIEQALRKKMLGRFQFGGHPSVLPPQFREAAGLPPLQDLEPGPPGPPPPLPRAAGQLQLDPGLVEGLPRLEEPLSWRDRAIPTAGSLESTGPPLEGIPRERKVGAGYHTRLGAGPMEPPPLPQAEGPQATIGPPLPSVSDITGTPPPSPYTVAAPNRLAPHDLSGTSYVPANPSGGINPMLAQFGLTPAPSFAQFAARHPVSGSMRRGLPSFGQNLAQASAQVGQDQARRMDWDKHLLDTYYGHLLPTYMHGINEAQRQATALKTLEEAKSPEAFAKDFVAKAMSQGTSSELAAAQLLQTNQILGSFKKTGIPAASGTAPPVPGVPAISQIEYGPEIIKQITALKPEERNARNFLENLVAKKGIGYLEKNWGVLEPYIKQEFAKSYNPLMGRENKFWQFFNQGDEVPASEQWQRTFGTVPSYSSQLNEFLRQRAGSPIRYQP